MTLTMRIFMISSLVAISVVSIRFNDGSDGQLNLDNDVVDDDILSVNDKVTILAGKYAGCSGVVEKVSGRKNKVKVRRNCGDGRRGDGKSWWYKPGQVEEIIEDEATGAKEEDAPQEQGISLVVNAEFHRKHLLCDRYKDLPAINPRAKPPVLGGRPVVRRGQEVLFKAHGDVVSSMTSADVEVLGAKTPIGSISARIQGEEIYLNLPALAPVGEYELRLYKAKKIVATFPFIVVFNPFTCSDCPEHSDEHEEYVAGDEGLLWQGLSDDHTANIWHHEPFRAANLLISLALLQHLPLELRGDVVAVSRFLTNAVGEKVCYGKWGDGNYATGKPAKGYRCKSKKSIKRHADKWSHTCHDPSTWHGSSPLLEQHWGLVQSGAPGTAVQYCQCFVFSGVLTTIGRSLGLATRSVTNFQSAHDVNSDRGVSKFFFSTPEGIWDPVDFPDELCPDWCEKSKKCEGCETALRRGRGFSGKCKACIPCVPCHSRDDSIWSFHVWNEMYFSRGKETTNGWQTLDATPQELSNGKFQMGPASVKEVQNGTSDCYDTDFVIGEVNGDIKLYVYNVPDLNEKTKIRAMDKGDFVLHNGDPLFLGFRWYTDPFGETYNNVGFKIVTKKPGPIARKCVKNPAKCQMEELDLTPTYKQCPDAQDRQMPFCAAGYQINKATCADPGKTMLSLLEQKEANLLEDTAFRQAGKIHELTGSHVKDVEALEWLVDFNCPKIISHPVVVLFTDMLWTRVAMYYFLIGRLYFFITLSVFAFSQALLPSTDGAMSKEGNVAVFICRCFIYLGSMCHLLIRSIRLCYKDIRDRNFSRIWRIPVPEHLCCMTELGYIALFWTLLMMCIQEPIWWCLNDPSGDGLLFTSNCDGALYRADSYAALSCVAMLLYCALIINLSILSMRISSFVMMCGRVLAEVGLFLMAACFLIISFALGISALSHRSSAFQGLDNAAYSLFAIMIGLFPARDLDQMQDEIGVIITVSIFVIFIAIFLLNLLVAQLNQAYQIIFPDMQGYARLTRASVIVSAVEHASTQRWTRFLQGLHFDQRLEFEEGDVGLAGGIQVTEPSWAHPTTVDSIRRFGGSTSPEMPWPEDERLLTDDDRFERLEKLILRCTKGKKKRGEGTGDSSMRSGTGTSEGSYKSDSSNNSE